MGHNRCLIFYQIPADEERRVSQRIVVVQHPSLVFPQFRPLLLTASLKRANTSWYNCLFTVWPRGTNSWRTVPLQSKNTTNNTFIFDWLIHACFYRHIQSSPYAWLSIWYVSVKFLPSWQQNFTLSLSHTHTHTHFFKHFHCHSVTNPTNSLCTCSVQ